MTYLLTNTTPTMMNKRRRRLHTSHGRQRSLGITAVITLVALSCLFQTVDSFVLPQQQLGSTGVGLSVPTIRSHVTSVPPRPLPTQFPTKSSNPAASTALKATGIEPVLLLGSAVGHILGGNLATPIVIDAVKTWYTRIKKPSWTPPNKIFAPVWTLLYGSLGVALARVAHASAGNWQSLPVLAWGCHYALNLVWAPLFFGMAKLRTALVVNYLLVASMPVIFKLFAAVDRTAALLLVPYTAWIVFATILNHSICKLNPMDGTGYSRALMEKEIAALQKEAARKVGLMEKAKKMGVVH